LIILTPDVSDSPKQSVLMKQTTNIYTSVGIAALFITDIIHVSIKVRGVNIP
jgi:hypothetical protein